MRIEEKVTLISSSIRHQNQQEGLDPLGVEGRRRLTELAQHCPVLVLIMFPNRAESNPSFLPMSMASARPSIEIPSCMLSTVERDQLTRSPFSDVVRRASRP